MSEEGSFIGLIGLAVMGQNLALNIADNGFSISVYNRTTSKVDDTVHRAQKELGSNEHLLRGTHNMGEFVASLSVPRKVIIMVKAGKPVDDMIDQLLQHLDAGDLIIDGGNEWFENTEQRSKRVMKEKGVMYMGMGVSGGEEGARYGPSLMPGGPAEAYKLLEPMLVKIAAKSEDTNEPCVTHIGPGGSGNYVKMVHNGIEYGDMQLIAEVYDLMRTVGQMSNDEISEAFAEWNRGPLRSFLIEITATIFKKRDDKQGGASGYLIDQVLDKSGSKGTGMWTVQQAAARGVAAPTICAALESRYLSSLKQERVEASKKLHGIDSTVAPAVDKAALVRDLEAALYSSKICSYAQGMNIMKQAAVDYAWTLNFGEIARIWKAGCIIRAVFLDRITRAYKKNPNLSNLLVDDEFASEINDRQRGWRNVITVAIQNGIPVPALSGSLAYYDAYRRDRLPANLIQAQRDFFGAHTYQRVDEGENGEWHHSQWAN